MNDRETLIKAASEHYLEINPGWSAANIAKLMADFALSQIAAQAERVRAWRERCEELEVVAAALYLGHDDGKAQFDMYKTVYLDKNGETK